jgi:hypothetical protein
MAADVLTTPSSATVHTSAPVAFTQYTFFALLPRCTRPSAPITGAVHAVSPTNVLAVGSNGVIARFDGTTWSAMTSGTTRNLFAVWIVLNHHHLPLLKHSGHAHSCARQQLWILSHGHF